ncbi:MAG: hypothetical protein GEV06_08570 [Luteitalea sp.]|nr:hypothetical protein [Luteitalea sp.]
MRIASFLLVGVTAISVTLSAQQIDSNTIESSLSPAARTGWSEDFTIAGFSGHDGGAPVVYDFARGPDGKVLATGRFQWMGDRRVDPVVQLDHDTWQPVRRDWGREVPLIGFSAIAVSDTGAIALSTYSGPFGAAPGEIWMETQDGAQVIGRLRGSVRSMVWFERQLWVAGFFVMEDAGVTNLAVWDGATWSAPPGGLANDAVYRLSVSDDTLLMAGDFTSIGGIAASHVAEWNGADWTAYDLTEPIEVGHVYAVTRTEAGELFAGGAISGGLVRWTGAGWEPVSGGVFFGEFYGVVSDMVMHRGDLYVTGCFSSANSIPSDPSSVRAESVARWTGTEWEGLDDGSEPVGTTWFEWGVCGFEPNQFTIWDVRYQRLFSDGERVYLGGHLPGVAGVPSQSIVAFDGREWQGFGQSNDGLFGYASAVAVGGWRHSTYVLGLISHAGTASRTSGIFRYDQGPREGRWTAVGGPLPEDLRCSQLAVDPWERVFVGCQDPSGPGVPVVLMLRGDEWVSLGPLDVEGTVWDMRVDRRGRVWLAGGVRTGDSSGSGFVARWDWDQFTVVEDGFNSMVFRVAFPPGGSAREGEVIAAGAFTQIGSDAFARIARLRGGQWEPLGSDLSAAVLALAWGEDAVYASTENPSDPSVEHLLLGRWDGTQWEEVATPDNGLPPPREETVHAIRDLLALGRYVVAVGSLWPETGGRNAFIYDDRQRRIAPLDGGLNAIGVDEVALGRDGLWFGGAIAEAGSGDTRIPSVGVAHFRLRP